MLLVGVRIPSEYLFDLSKQIAGQPCLYFYVYENGIYVGKTYGKKGPYDRYKDHMERAQRISLSGRGRPKEIVLVWDEKRILSEKELGSLEAVYIHHFPRNVGTISRTNINAMQIVYGEGVRDANLWAAYVATQRILVQLGLLQEPIRQVLCWKELICPATERGGVLPFRYLSDITRIPDTVVLHAASEQLSMVKMDRYWPAVRLPNARHRRIRFVAFHTNSNSLSHFAEIESKQKVGENTSSITYNLKLKSSPFSISADYQLIDSSVAAQNQRYVLLETLLMGNHLLSSN